MVSTIPSAVNGFTNHDALTELRGAQLRVHGAADHPDRPAEQRLRGGRFARGDHDARTFVADRQRLVDTRRDAAHLVRGNVGRHQRV
jgi:hypothetical protein